MELRQAVFAFTAAGPAFQDLKFRDQIREATRSATNNIAEGFARFTPREFRRFLSIARGSLTEAHNQLQIAHECRYLADDEYERLSLLAARAATATTRLMRYLDSGHGTA